MSDFNDEWTMSNDYCGNNEVDTIYNGRTSTRWFLGDAVDEVEKSVLGHSNKEEKQEEDRKVNVSIDKIIFNKKATVVIWKDGEKTVVQKLPGDKDDPYAAVAQALAKRVYKSTATFHNMVDNFSVHQKTKEERNATSKRAKSDMGNRRSKGTKARKDSRSE